ncbi:hypothetical protein D9M69_513520 [compost metagenome]
MAVGGELAAELRSWVILAVLQQGLRIGPAVAGAAGAFGFVAVAAVGQGRLGFSAGRNDQVVVRRTVLAAYQPGVVAALAGPVSAERRDIFGGGGRQRADRYALDEFAATRLAEEVYGQVVQAPDLERRSLLHVHVGPRVKLGCRWPALPGVLLA